jgi:oligopeptide transport system substrate-binding protein
MKKSVSIVFGLLVVASMLLAACQPQVQTVVETVVVTKEVIKEGEKVIETVVVTQEVPVAPPEEEKAPVLRINLTSYPDIVDPQKSSFVNEIAHLKLIYEGLTKFNDKLETIPGAAESWVYNDDATELTFTLRKDLKYSDGALLNAKRFEYALQRNIDPETAGEYASITDEIAGAPEWRAADPGADGYDAETFKAALGVKALDAAGNPCADYEQADCLTLKINLSKPAPYFHTIMGIWVAFPARQELIEEGGENWWNSSKFQIGNGPYILKSLEPFVRGYFTPNPNYWEGVGAVDLEYSYITDTAVAFEAYKNNEFDIITAAAEDIETIKNDAQLSQELLQYPGSCTFNMNFHQLKEPFTDKKVREGFVLALDRDAWVRDVLKGVGSPTQTWIPKGFPGYKEGETRWAYDPEGAKAAIAASTYGSIEALPEITLTFSDTPRNRTRNEWLAAKWKEVLGVDIKLNPVEPTTYTALTKDVATAPQTFILGWCADYPDPQNWLSVYWRSDTTFASRIGYKNEDFDALVNQADVELDPAKRADLYQQAQDVLVDSLPGAFMWNNINSYLVKPWVKGVVTTPQDADWAGSINPSGITIDTAMMP